MSRRRQSGAKPGDDRDRARETGRRACRAQCRCVTGTRATLARTGISQIVNSRPVAPPTRPSERLSVSSWRPIRPRAAPSASRTPISRWRAIALARRRFATLTHASSSTRPIDRHHDDDDERDREAFFPPRPANGSKRTPVRASPGRARDRCRVTGRESVARSAGPAALARPDAAALSSAWACAFETPSATRPTMLTVVDDSRSSGGPP